MQRLILMVGLPGSGKSTWARKYSDRYSTPIVNRDSVRRALHGSWWAKEAEDMVAAIAKVMVKALFLAGHNEVILDEANHTRRARDEWRKLGYEVALVVIGTPPDECKRRARSRKDAWDGDFGPIIDRMAGEWDDPNLTGELDLPECS
jgi:predicted kinase